MKAQIKDASGAMVVGVSIMIPISARTRLRKIMGDHDLGALSLAFDLLLTHFEKSKAQTKDQIISKWKQQR